MVSDAEVLKVMVEVLLNLDVGDFIVKVNHRAILDGVFEVILQFLIIIFLDTNFKICGVPADMIRSISSAVDKLDKMSWDKVKEEMIEKGLDGVVADKIGVYCNMSGGRELCEALEKDMFLASSEKIKRGISELKLLFNYLDAFGVSDKLVSQITDSLSFFQVESSQALFIIFN
jgi:histidyl-tRNA synthetase